MSDQQLIDDHIEYHEKIRGYGHEVTHFVTSSPTLKAHRRILANWVRFVTLSDTTLTKANGELVISFISLRQSEKVLNSTIMNELCIIRGFYECLSGINTITTCRASISPLYCAKQPMNRNTSL